MPVSYELLRCGSKCCRKRLLAAMSSAIRQEAFLQHLPIIHRYMFSWRGNAELFKLGALSSCTLSQSRSWGVYTSSIVFVVVAFTGFRQFELMNRTKKEMLSVYCFILVFENVLNSFQTTIVVISGRQLLKHKKKYV